MHKNTLTKQLLIIGLLILFSLLSAVFYSSMDQQLHSQSVQLPKRAVPEFSLPSLHNPNILITQNDLPNAFYLLHFWASSCEKCRLEHPLLAVISRSDTLKIIGINFKDNAIIADDYLHKYGNPYILNIYDFNGELAEKMGVDDIPETYLIAPNGAIIYRHIGQLTQNDWETHFVQQIINGGQ